MPGTEPSVVTAEAHLASMQSLLRSAMAAVAPTASARPDEPPVRFPCESPHEGEIYYTWRLAFDLPAGQHGDAVVPALVDWFTAKGFTMSTEPDTDEALVARGSDATTGVALSGAHKIGKVSIEGSSACGAAAP